MWISDYHMFCVSVLSTEFLQLHRFSNNFDISMETRQVNHFQAYVLLEPCFTTQDEVYTRKRSFCLFFVTSAAVVTPMLFYG